jgi:putative peptide zinc metalloprotease protein
MPMRRLTTALLTLLLAAGFAAASPAPARADDNTAIAINTKDGSALFKFAFSVKRVAGDVVDNGNAAVAFASCENCQTVAIAIQIVLVTGDPSVVTPTNLALAYNFECTLCETMASAYQFVFGNGDNMRFSAEGRRALAEIRKEFHDLRKESEQLSLAEIDARVEQLVDRIREVLRTELVPAGNAKPDDEDDDEQEPTTTTTPSTTTTPTTTAPTTTTTEPGPTTTEETTTTTTTPSTTTTP